MTAAITAFLTTIWGRLLSRLGQPARPALTLTLTPYGRRVLLRIASQLTDESVRADADAVMLAAARLDAWVCQAADPDDMWARVEALRLQSANTPVKIARGAPAPGHPRGELGAVAPMPVPQFLALASTLYEYLARGETPDLTVADADEAGPHDGAPLHLPALASLAPAMRSDAARIVP